MDLIKPDGPDGKAVNGRILDFVEQESEALVHFMLAIGVAQSTQDAHGLVAGPDRPAWGRVAVEKTSSASYSVDLTQARKSSRSRSVMPSACSWPSGLHMRDSGVCSQHG